MRNSAGAAPSALPTPRYPSIRLSPSMQISPSPPGAASAPSGSRNVTCWPASTVPTDPTRRACGGFIVDVQVASDKP
ncbi:hypothetical protein D3C71_1698870 [compost metagenome]